MRKRERKRVYEINVTIYVACVAFDFQFHIRGGRQSHFCPKWVRVVTYEAVALSNFYIFFCERRNF